MADDFGCHQTKAIVVKRIWIYLLFEYLRMLRNSLNQRIVLI